MIVLLCALPGYAQHHTLYITEHFTDTPATLQLIDTFYGRSWLQDGEYFMEPKGEGMFASIVPTPVSNHCNFDLTFTASWHGGVENYGYGIRWGELTGPKGNVFNVTHQKYADLWGADDKEPVHIAPARIVSSLRTNIFNRFRIQCRRHHVKIWINDELYYEGKPKQYAGYICLVVYNEQTVSFDEVKLEYQP